MTQEQWDAARPPLGDFAQDVLTCWNFAGGWDVDKLCQAAVFHDVADLDRLLWLAQVIDRAVQKHKAALREAPADGAV